MTHLHSSSSLRRHDPNQVLGSELSVPSQPVKQTPLWLYNFSILQDDGKVLQNYNL